MKIPINIKIKIITLDIKKSGEYWSFKKNSYQIFRKNFFNGLLYLIKNK